MDAYPLDGPGLISADEIAAAWNRELPDLPTASIPVVTNIWRLAKLLADDRRRTLAQAGVDAATLDLLSTLRRHGEPYEMSTKDLARQTLVTAGAISQRVARAEEAGLVTRRNAGGRPKAVIVTLTDEGHRTVEGLVETVLRREDGLLGDLSGEDRERLAELLRTLLDEVRRLT